MQTGEFQSGQMGQTVNLVAYAFAGSNPASPNRRILKSASCLFSDVDSFRTARPCEKTVLTEIFY